MASIVGEKYRYATTSDISSLDSQLAAAQSNLDHIQQMYTDCRNAKINNILYDCKSHQGFTLSSLSNHLSTAKQIVEDLDKQRTALITNVTQTSALEVQVGQATQAAGQGIGMAAIYGLIAVIAIIAGFVIYKKYKKKL